MEEFPAYFDPAALNELEGLQLKARGIVEGLVSGRHRSPFRGFSVEFAEHREYSPGDDLRYVDWKVFGRTDRFYLKRFEEETSLSCHILLDCSESMAYGSNDGLPSKWEFASLIAACLSYLVIRQHDAVGAVLFHREIIDFQRPSSQPAHWKQMVQRIADLQPQESTSLPNVLDDVSERIGRRGVLLVLSDFLGAGDQLDSALRHLGRFRHDIRLFQIVDPAEQDFPFEEATLFRGLEETGVFLGDPAGLRAAYRAEFEGFTENLGLVAREAGMSHDVIRTDQSVPQVLRRLMQQRGAGNRRSQPSQSTDWTGHEIQDRS